MDDTTIGSGRVRMGFSLTAVVALSPLLLVLIEADRLPVTLLPEAGGGYRGILLGVGSVVLTAVGVGLVALAVTLARRVVRRPVRA